MAHYTRGVGRLETAAVLLSTLAAVSACLAKAGAQPLRPAGGALFHADANLILVPVTVTDGRGASIEGLGAERFTVLDNRRAQAIQAFYTEDAPSSIGIVLDVSGSTQATVDREKAAARAFLRLSNPDDEFFLVAVSSSPRMLAERIDDPETIAERMRWETAGGATALHDTLIFALRQARRCHKPRRALLVISDGMENNSRYTRGELMRDVLESDTQIYTIAIENPVAGTKGAAYAESRRGLALLRDLAERSGGLSVSLRTFEDPAAAAARISAAVRGRYVIGYRGPDDGQSSKWHKIEVKTDLRRANVYARGGYRLQ